MEKLRSHQFTGRAHAPRWCLLPGLLPIWFARLIKLQARLQFGLATGGRKLNGPGLPLDRLGELSTLRIGGGQRIQHAGIVPAEQLTRSSGERDSLFTISIFFIGTGRRQPCQVIVSLRVLGIEFDRHRKVA